MLVVREFKEADRGTSATFAPTSGLGVRLLLVAYCCLAWSLRFLDIKDLFFVGGTTSRKSVSKSRHSEGMHNLVDRAGIGPCGHVCQD